MPAFVVGGRVCTPEQKYDKSGNTRGGHQIISEVFVPGPKAPLNPPHGGKLVNVMASSERAEEVSTPGGSRSGA
jgi:hypothetical protein